MILHPQPTDKRSVGAGDSTHAADSAFGSLGRFASVAATMFALAIILSGCGPKPDPAFEWPMPVVRRIAIVPVLDFSGSSLNPITVSDWLASEFVQHRGVTVIPVNRVVATLMSRSGGLLIRSPQHALEICRAVGADAIVIPAITEYRPYPPMMLDLTIEMYALPELARNPESLGPDELGGQADLIQSIQPVAMVQFAFDASQLDVSDAVREFGTNRSARGGPAGWRRYLITQEGYMRFCFSKSIEMMFDRDSYRMRLARISDG